MGQIDSGISRLPSEDLGFSETILVRKPPKPKYRTIKDKSSSSLSSKAGEDREEEGGEEEEEADEDQRMLNSLLIYEGTDYDSDNFFSETRQILSSVINLETKMMDLKSRFSESSSIPIEEEGEEGDEMRQENTRMISSMNKLKDSIEWEIFSLKGKLESEEMKKKANTDPTLNGEDDGEETLKEERNQFFQTTYKRLLDVKEEFDEGVMYFREMRREEVREYLSKRDGGMKEVTEKQIDEYFRKEDLL